MAVHSDATTACQDQHGRHVRDSIRQLKCLQKRHYSGRFNKEIAYLGQLQRTAGPKDDWYPDISCC